MIKKVLKNLFVTATQAYFSFYKSKVECNICHYKANKFFSDGWHEEVRCPNCGSGIRQRLLWATLEHTDKFSFKRVIEGRDVLHFAPEKNISSLINKLAKVYKTADLLVDGYAYDKIDFNLDISNRPSIWNEAFDCVIACDVLEHVHNHIMGMREIYRILKKGGNCLLTVPQRDNMKITYEDSSITNPLEREKAFGQYDHLRIYGDDFSSMLEKCGFIVTEINEKNFPKELVERNVLFPPKLSQRENVTNFRKVFIGQKPA